MSQGNDERPPDAPNGKDARKRPEQLAGGAPAEEAAGATPQVEEPKQQSQGEAAAAEGEGRKPNRLRAWAGEIATSVRDDFAKDTLKATIKLGGSYFLGVLSTLGILQIAEPAPTYNDGFIPQADGGPGHAYLSSLIDHVQSTSGAAVRWSGGFDGLMVYCRGFATRGIEPLDLLEAFENQFPSCLSTVRSDQETGIMFELTPGPGLDGPHMMPPMTPAPTEVWFCGCDQSVIDDVGRKREALFGPN